MLSAVDPFNANELDSYRIKVHGIKGASFDLFADDIVEKSAALEDAADRGDIDFIKKHNPAFLEAAWSLIHGIEELLSSLSDPSQKSVKDKPDKESLKKLYTACAGHHMDGVDEAITAISQYEYQNDDGLVDVIRQGDRFTVLFR
jgi:hypothetical protein